MLPQLILPVSLEKFKALFLADDAPFFYDKILSH
jgi:hypothetical protein